MNAIVILSLMAIAVISFVLQGLRKIPANPPTKAVVTLFGKRTVEIKDEGWRFFPLCPWWHGYILVNVTKKNQDFLIKSIKTPDLAEFEIPVSFTITPDCNNLIHYLDYQGEPGVWKNLKEIVEEKLRIWAIAADEGPETAEEALAAGDDAVAILIKAIAGTELSKVPSPYPTTVLLKALNKPKPKPPLKSEEKFGKNWEEIAKWFEKLSPAEQKKVNKALEERKKFLAQIRRGNGTIAITSMGIILNRLNIGEIKAVGKFAEVADLVVKKRKEKEAEIVEIEYVAKIMETLKKQLGISNEQALEILQTERGKVIKTINENKWNISPETREMIEKVTPKLLESFLAGIKK